MTTTPSDVMWRQGWAILLRPLERADAPVARRGINDPEVTKYLARYLPIGEQEEENFINSPPNPMNGFTLGIVRREDKKLIGTMGLHNIHWTNRTAITGTMIWEKDCWGKGYATEAKMLLLDAAFNAMDLYAVGSRVFAPNGASLKYAQKCGYREVARIPNWARMKDGTRADEVILLVTQEEWRPLWQTYCAEKGERN